MKTNNSAMTIFGVGPKIGRITMPFFLLTLVLTFLFPHIFSFPVMIPVLLLRVIGIVLIVLGLTVNITAALPMIKAVREGKLLTTGYYSICRNPMYASFVYLTIPGIALLCNSWLIILISAVVCVALNKIVPAEEALLENAFGNEYTNYEQRVNRIVPFIKGY